MSEHTYVVVDALDNPHVLHIQHPKHLTYSLLGVGSLMILYRDQSSLDL